MTSKNPKVTPMMAQYLQTKEQYPECLLFYRMGDFYELFFEDAITAAAELDIALTKRGKYLDEDIPMCGVPHHAYENYLVRLIKKGFKIAVCEQLESPAEAKKRGTNSVVKRDVVRIITQGTLTEDVVLDAKSNNFLLAVTINNKNMGIALVDVSTGEFQTFAHENNINNLANILTRFNPKEILVADTVYDSVLRPAFIGFEKNVTTLPLNRYNLASAKQRLQSFYQVLSLDTFGNFSDTEIISCGVLLDYIDLTQKGKMPRLLRPVQLSQNKFMEIDNASMRNLEIFTNTRGEKINSLMSVVNDAITSAGSRLLYQFMGMPLLDIEAINKRYDMVDFFIINNDIRIKLRYILGLMSDIERSLSRISCGRGGPRDLLAVGITLDLIPDIRNTINNVGQNNQEIAYEVPAELQNAMEKLGFYNDLCATLRQALQEEVPLMARDGNFIASGYDAGLDAIKVKRDEGKRLIAELQAKYSSLTSVSNLKILYNNQLGYFIEVSSRFGDILLGMTDKFIHRQTMANAMRFSTEELINLEEEIRNAGDKALVMELDIFANLCDKVLQKSEEITATAKAIALIDVMAGFANVAVVNNYRRPILDNSFDFDVKGARHPIVEQSLKKGDKEFIANDCELAKRLWILTGPNMAGKSTYLRQNALLVIMAQMGCFVPVDSMRMGIVDKLFSRVGASDDIARGHSTFMVEMIETATILNQATEKSLVILDEIGRGTATFDGLSIAWAVVEYLHDKIKCRSLFATHYHELVALASRLDNIALATMKVKEWKGDIIFLHEVTSGSADRSYGIHVAKLAGLPEIVIKRAKVILEELETSDSKSAKTIIEELPLFQAILQEPSARGIDENHPLFEELSALNPDDLSPKEALEKLYSLKKLLD